MHRTGFFAAALLVLLVSGCAGENPDKPRLDAYDRIDMLRARYNDSLENRAFTETARIELEIEREATRILDTLLNDAIHERSSRRRYLAAFALTFSRKADLAGPVLTQLLSDADPDVRVQAAVGLGQLRVPNPPIPQVIALLDDPSLHVRLGALVALRMLLTPGHDAGLEDRLVGLLDDPSWEIRSEVALVMRRVRKGDFMKPLAIRGFRDPHFLVRLNSAMAIGEYGPPALGFTGNLIELLRDFEAPVVEAAHWALKQVTNNDFDRSYHTWRDWYEDWHPKYVEEERRREEERKKEEEERKKAAQDPKSGGKKDDKK